MRPKVLLPQLHENSVFVRHEPCPRCQSSDNLGRYSDGHAHCFGGCGYYERSPGASIHDLHKVKKVDIQTRLALMPDDVTITIPREPLLWLLNYGINEGEVATYKYLWSPSKKWLILPLFSGCNHDGDQEVVAFQARNFSESGPKYITDGPISRHCFVTGLLSRRKIVILVEDAVSTIRVGREATTMCLFGSHVGNFELMQAKFLAPKCIIWLDYDKRKVAQETARKLSAFGFPSTTIITGADPKALSQAEIKGYVDEAERVLDESGTD